MYKIGEFSKMTNISIKTLRYYDKEGILIPEKRSDKNAYRYYDEKDFQKAKFIRNLRELSFSIAEIKDVLNLVKDDYDLSFILREKMKMIEKEIISKQKMIKNINASIKSKIKESIDMNYEIKVKEFPELTVASIRYKGKYSDCSKYISKLYKAVKDKASGTCFNCYYDEGYMEVADIEVCLPVNQKIIKKDISFKTFPKIEALTTIHKGCYEDIGYAYKALFDYADRKEMELVLPTREVYIKGPGMIFKGNPHKYVTEIIIPIRV